MMSKTIKINLWKFVRKQRRLGANKLIQLLIVKLYLLIMKVDKNQ